MDPEVQVILRKTAAYVEMTQPLIDTHNEQRAVFVKKATAAAQKLVRAGLLEKVAIDKFVERAAAQPESVWEVVEKLTSITGGVDSLGSVSSEKIAGSAAPSDPWEKLLCGGERNSPQSNGLID